MFEIRADQVKNRLYFTLGVIEGEAEREMIIVKTTEATKRLRPGFTCLSDLRGFRLEGSQDDGFMRECQEALWDAAIGKVVRVSGSGRADGHFSFERGSLVWPAYMVSAACSIEEGEALLDAAEETALAG